MTKEQFKDLFNEVIRKFNSDHNLHLIVIMTETKRGGSSEILMDTFCPKHVIYAQAALAQTLAEHVAKLADKLDEVTDTVNGKIADMILKSMPHDPNERGA